MTREYLELTRELSAKLDASRPRIHAQCQTVGDWVLEVPLDYFRQQVSRHRELLDRRVLQGQTIPASEKVYSLFEPHTEWINKGKAHRGVELGHRILLATEQHQLIIDYRVPAGVDVSESIGVADRLLGQYGAQAMGSLSFDKGFTEAESKELIERYIPLVVMPKRGKKTLAQTEAESQRKFAQVRRAHSAVESAINALEHHGLNRCLDLGLAGFERYVGFGVLAYNLHLIGRRLLHSEIEEQRAAA